MYFRSNKFFIKSSLKLHDALSVIVGVMEWLVRCRSELTKSFWSITAEKTWASDSDKEKVFMKIPLYIQASSINYSQIDNINVLSVLLKVSCPSEHWKGEKERNWKKYTCIQHYNKTMCHAFRSSLGKTVPRKMLPFSENHNLNW